MKFKLKIKKIVFFWLVLLRKEINVRTLLKRLIPESPFWLLSTGRNEQAKELLSEIAKTNGIKDFDADEAINLYRKNEVLTFCLIP